MATSYHAYAPTYPPTPTPTYPPTSHSALLAGSTDKHDPNTTNNTRCANDIIVPNVVTETYLKIRASGLCAAVPGSLRCGFSGLGSLRRKKSGRVTLTTHAPLPPPLQKTKKKQSVHRQPAGGGGGGRRRRRRRRKSPIHKALWAFLPRLLRAALIGKRERGDVPD